MGRVSPSADGKPWTPCLADLLGHDGYRTGMILAHERHLPLLLPSPLQAVEASAKESEDPLAGLIGFDLVRLAKGADGLPGARADTVAKEALQVPLVIRFPVPRGALLPLRPRFPHPRVSGPDSRAIRTRRWKLSERVAGTTYELYDIVTDPLEVDNLLNSQPGPM